MKIIMNWKDYLTGSRALSADDKRSINSQGGAMLPLSMAECIIAAAVAENPLVGLSTHSFVNGLKSKNPYLESDVNVKWTGEGEAIQESDFAMGGFVASMNKMSALQKLSTELVTDGFYNIESELVNSFGRATGAMIEKAGIDGDGAGKPKGFLKNGIIKEVAEINVESIIELYNALDIKYLNGAAFLISKDLFSALSVMADDNGNRIMSPNTENTTEGLRSAGFIFGRPCYVTFMPDTHPIAFGNFSFYRIVETLPVIQRLNELYATDGFIGIKMTNYVDGNLLKSDAVIALKVV